MRSARAGALYNAGMQRPGLNDRVIAAIEQGLRALGAAPVAARPSPALAADDAPLSAAERRQSAALLRVNHAGELAAQALYSRPIVARPLRRYAAPSRRGRGRGTRPSRLVRRAARRARRSPERARSALVRRLVPASAHSQARCGDRTSLGFVAETEKQVEAHLNDHLRRLPAHDRESGDDPRAHGRGRSASRHDGEPCGRRAAAGGRAPLHGDRRRRAAPSCASLVTPVTTCNADHLRLTGELIKYGITSNRSPDLWKKPLGP